jgi:beta-glucosidase-like glycosyl hydrolase
MMQVMIPHNYTKFIDGLTLLVKKNAIPMSRIDDAVTRILRVKFVMGLFENPLAGYSLADHLGSQVSRSSRSLLIWVLLIYVVSVKIFYTVNQLYS